MILLFPVPPYLKENKNMAMSSSSGLTNPSRLHLQLWLPMVKLLILFTIFYSILVVSGTETLYSQHCASLVPESTPKAYPQFSTMPFPPNQDGYYHGGEEISAYRPRNSSRYYYRSSNNTVLLFQTQKVYGTDADGIYKVEGSLILETTVYYVDRVSYSYSYSTEVIPSISEYGDLSFKLEGFWSKSTGKLCMVGSSSTNLGGRIRVFTGVLKLRGVTSPTGLTSLIKGTLESLSSADESAYFSPISLLMFPKVGYKYTEAAKEANHVCAGGVQVPKDFSLSLPLSVSICPIFSGWHNSYKLEYASGCSSTKSCSPFHKGIGYLPEYMSFHLIQCSDDVKSLRFRVVFHNRTTGDYYSLFNPKTSLVAEGSWDAESNRLCLVACRILNATKSLNDSLVGDCSVRLSLRFPAVWSIQNSSSTLGEVWSNETANDPGYFDRITFRSYENDFDWIPGRKYNYTLVEKAKNSCLKEKPDRNEGKVYPDGKSQDMRLDFSVKNAEGRSIGWGNMEPVFVGDQAASRDTSYKSVTSSGLGHFLEKEKGTDDSLLNISYRITYRLFNETPSFSAYNISENYLKFQVSAEGVYSAETGILCMVGCQFSGRRRPVDDTQDCEIRVSLQFPPMHSNERIKGDIESTRDASAPLYFKPMSISASSYYRSQSRESIQRMDMEIVVALISNTLVCAIIVYQILYVKKHPEVFPFISLLMLAILVLGHMIPLVLNFEALFMPKQNQDIVLQRTGGWLEVNEVIVRAVTMVAFLLQFRLLVLIWSSKMADGSQKPNWVAENRTLYVSLPLYLAGGLLALFIHWWNYRLGKENWPPESLWTDLKSYAGLVLDGFLFPQIMLNIFMNSRENALSRFFYLGNTFVRLLPHAYDLYRAHHYVDAFDESYIYANPGADYYSTAWDIVIPSGALLFAAIIYLQQRFGGRFFLHKRFKDSDGYEKVSVAIDA